MDSPKLSDILGAIKNLKLIGALLPTVNGIDCEDSFQAPTSVFTKMARSQQGAPFPDAFFAQKVDNSPDYLPGKFH